MTFCRTANYITWSEGVSACQGIGMQLVEMTTAAKAAAVESWCTKDCGWIGMSCPSKTSACDTDISLWSWSVDGSSVSSTYNELSLDSTGTIYGGGPNEYCGHWWDTGRWAPALCTGGPNLQAICESASGGGGSAVGDPHLQNVHGERFDLMKPGKHVLLNIPRGKSADNALLRVEARANQLGGQCSDMYFQELNVTGSWAEAKKAGGYHHSALQHDVEAPEWVVFGQVELKVVHGHTNGGLKYLNVFVKHLGRAGFVVGGLLGEDDHSDVIQPDGSCVGQLALLAIRGKGGQEAPSVLSVAVASF